MGRTPQPGRKPLRRSVAIAASVAAVIGTGALAGAAAAPSASAAPLTAAPAPAWHGGHSGINHVLLISVDGLHQQDLAWYVHAYPDSVLASLYDHGTEYSAAMTPFPSDSYPGMVAQA